MNHSFINNNNWITKKLKCIEKWISKIKKRKCNSIILSEHTTIEDLLGRDYINIDNSIIFKPGLLLNAFIEGKTIILDECDLAKPEILSYILGTITKNKLIISNKVFLKDFNFNVILTMNGESKFLMKNKEMFYLQIFYLILLLFILMKLKKMNVKKFLEEN